MSFNSGEKEDYWQSVIVMKTLLGAQAKHLVSAEAIHWQWEGKIRGGQRNRILWNILEKKQRNYAQKPMY